MYGEKGPSLFGVWVALVEAVARKLTRGWLCGSLGHSEAPVPSRINKVVTDGCLICAVFCKNGSPTGGFTETELLVLPTVSPL